MHAEIQALDRFLGKDADEVAKEHGVTTATVYASARKFKGRQSDILKTYFAAPEGTGREAVKRAFGDDVEEEEGDDWRQTLEQRVQTLERDLAALLDAATSSPKAEISPPAAVKPQPQPAVSEPLPRLTFGSVRPAEPELSPGVDDPRAGGLRVHITHQVVDQWRKLFGNAGINGTEVDEHDLMRRIRAVYHDGNLTGKGMVWTCTSVDRYSMTGVRFGCTVQRGIVHIATVAKVGLDEI